MEQIIDNKIKKIEISEQDFQDLQDYCGEFGQLEELVHKHKERRKNAYFTIIVHNVKIFQGSTPQMRTDLFSRLAGCSVSAALVEQAWNRYQDRLPGIQKAKSIIIERMDTNEKLKQEAEQAEEDRMGYVQLKIEVATLRERLKAYETNANLGYTGIIRGQLFAEQNQKGLAGEQPLQIVLSPNSTATNTGKNSMTGNKRAFGESGLEKTTENRDENQNLEDMPRDF